jgi:hypothetical protein
MHARQLYQAACKRLRSALDVIKMADCFSLGTGKHRRSKHTHQTPKEVQVRIPPQQSNHAISWPQVVEQGHCGGSRKDLHLQGVCNEFRGGLDGTDDHSHQSNESQGCI